MKLSKKDKIVWASGLFVTVVFLAIYYRFIENTKTRACLDNAAKKAAETRSLMLWASGNEKDVWGNTFVLERNEQSVQFFSKGADGKAGTKDDIHSKEFIKKKLVVAVPVKMEVRKTLWAKVKSKIWSD